VFKIDSSNLCDVTYHPDSLTQADLSQFIDTIKPDRSDHDLLFQAMLDWAMDLSLPIAQEIITGKSVYFVGHTLLAACFEMGIEGEFVKQLAAFKPERVVFREAGLATDAVKINVAQIFKQLSPSTTIRIL